MHDFQEPGTRIDDGARRERDDGNAEPAVERIRAVLRAANLDCACRGELDDALRQFSLFEHRRYRRSRLMKARHAKAAIAVLLQLLADIDEASEAEPDSTVFAEFADMFQTIAGEAMAGASAMRDLEAL